MEKEQLLRDPNICPTDEIIAGCIGSTFDLYRKFVDEIKKRGVELQWRYYNDAKAWLAKGIHIRTGARGGQKEITAFWLSIWDGFFKVSVFIPNKNRDGVLALPVGDTTREMIEKSEQVGKLKFFAVIFDVTSDTQLEDIYKVVEFRKGL